MLGHGYTVGLCLGFGCIRLGECLDAMRFCVRTTQFHFGQFGKPVMGNINDTIWITSRVRMIAERKAIENQNVSYLAVTYYSLFIIILSIFASY
jgi:hypothetical protein